MAGYSNALLSGRFLLLSASSSLDSKVLNLCLRNAVTFQGRKDLDYSRRHLLVSGLFTSHSNRLLGQIVAMEEDDTSSLVALLARLLCCSIKDLKTEA